MEGEIEYYSLTHPQKAIWYTEKMYAGTSIGNIAANLRLIGNVDFELLEKAINITIKKNDGTRLRMAEIDGEPKQYVSEYTYHKFNFYDFSGKEITELYKWDEEQSKIPFKLIDSDLFHFTLIKVNDNDGGFFAKFHHLISDAWNMSLLGNQIVEYYSALKNGEKISEEAKPSYIDYILSEEEYEKSKRIQKDREFWNSKFETWQEVTTLKARKTNNFNTKARRKTMLVPKKLTAKIHEYCLEKGVSEFAIFFAALSMYINRVTAKEDLTIGTTLLNRSNAAEKDTAGMFASVAVPMRVHIKDDMNLNLFVEVISKDTLSIFRHQKYPYDLLLKEVREKHKISGSLFDIVLTYQNSKFNKAEQTEEYITRWHFNGHQIESLIINISDREDEGHLIIDYDYLIDLFHATEIEFIHQHIINLLWHALDNPEKVISRLEMLSEKEKHKVLNEFNEIDRSKDKVVQKLLNDNSIKLTYDTKLYILDKNNNLLPIGIPGEICIGENEILSESLDKDELTQGKFISNPSVASGKLYKTGEFARWYPKGEIEYFGKIELIEAAKLSNIKTEVQVRIAATFTAEPIGDYIKWWGSKFGYSFKVEFAGYNQVFQELLNPDSKLSKNKDGINIVLIKFEDYIRNDNNTDESRILKLEQIFGELQDVISKFNISAPFIIAIFPVPTHLNLSDMINKKINELNTRFEETISKRNNAYVINLNEIQDLYNIDEVFDSLKDKEGHMPFIDEFYAAVGTEIARKIVAIKKQHFKVIVLDCDDTLWKGICGEQGALGVKIESAYKELQEFMLQKYNEGMLLAVCSKNNGKDVFEVFDKNPDMLLKRKHIINWKINWQEKSKNIKEIAKELNLGLDSFIFIDDSPIECSKMVENCPEVLTLQLPSEEEHIPLFLKHVWAFDRVKITKEDALRNSMYEVEQARQEASAGLLLDDFIKNLNLKVSMREIQDSEVTRAAQMTQRTNQFNLSTIRRAEQEITQLIQNSKTKCFVIEASDKFGGYGIVGLVILKGEKEKLFIDTFLLSCRILGRKTEDVILSGIRRYAEEQGKNVIEADFIPTEKNKPILEFIEKTNWNIVEKDEKHIRYSILAKDLPREIEHISFYFNEMYDKGHEEYPVIGHKKSVLYKEENNSKVYFNDFELCNTEMLEKSIHREYILPLENFTGKKLLKLPTYEKRSLKEGRYQVPTNQIEERLARVWEDIFKIEEVGIDDDFFKLGGDSLTAVQVLSNLHKYNLETKIQDIYKYPTIRELSNYIAACDEKTNESLVEQIVDRSNDYSNYKYTELQLEPLTDSILLGNLPRVDAVALNYIPDEFVTILGQSNVQSILDSFDNKSVLYNYMNTGFGNIGVIILPILGKDVYKDKEKLISLSTQAIILAEKMGAKVVSLTGLIPSASNYGLDIIESCKKRGSKVQITTGHATTSASVILSLTRLLSESGRRLSQEKICVLGLGSIGTTAIKLLLSVLPHPLSITLCDIYTKSEHLEKVEKELKEEYNFTGKIDVVYSEGVNLPSEVYQSTLIIGATNVPNILNVKKLSPGTLIVDDSAPHCFSKDEAISRLEKGGDILFTEGGTLESPNPINKRVYLPPLINSSVMGKYHQHFFSDAEITGCILSSLLSVKYKYLKPISGNVDIKDCIAHYEKLKELGFKGASLHCDDFILPRKYVEGFKQNFEIKG